MDPSKAFDATPNDILVSKFILHIVILIKPLHNHDIFAVQFNQFYCLEICDKLRKDLGAVQKCQHFHKHTNHTLRGERITPDVRF